MAPTASEPDRDDPYADVPGGSDRQFGIVFAVFFAVIATLPLWSGEPIRLWALPVSAVFALIAFVAPRLLSPLNALWTRLGLLMSAVVSPVVLAVIFYVGVVPLGAAMRLVGRAPIPTKRDPNASTYWIERQPPGPPPETMRNQF